MRRNLYACYSIFHLNLFWGPRQKRLHAASCIVPAEGMLMKKIVWFSEYWWRQKFQCMLVKTDTNIQFHTYSTKYYLNQHTFSSTSRRSRSCIMQPACWWKFFTNIQVFHQHTFSPTSFTNIRTAFVPYMFPLPDTTVDQKSVSGKALNSTSCVLFRKYELFFRTTPVQKIKGGSQRWLVILPAIIFGA